MMLSGDSVVGGIANPYSSPPPMRFKPRPVYTASSRAANRSANRQTYARSSTRMAYPAAGAGRNPGTINRSSAQAPVIPATMGGFMATVNYGGGRADSAGGRPGRAQPLRSPWPASMNTYPVQRATMNVKPGSRSSSWSGSTRGMSAAPRSASISMGRKGAGR